MHMYVNGLVWGVLMCLVTSLRVFGCAESIFWCLQCGGACCANTGKPDSALSPSEMCVYRPQSSQPGPAGACVSESHMALQWRRSALDTLPGVPLTRSCSVQLSGWHKKVWKRYARRMARALVLAHTSPRAQVFLAWGAVSWLGLAGLHSLHSRSRWVKLCCLWAVVWGGQVTREGLGSVRACCMHTSSVACRVADAEVAIQPATQLRCSCSSGTVMLED
jgi:hypothetical protein